MKLNWKTCLMAAATLFLLYIAIQVWPKVLSAAGMLLSAALPLLIGAVIAYVLGIPMLCYEKWFFPKCKKKWICALRRPVCIVLAFLTVAGIAALVVVLIVPQLIDCLQLLFGEVPVVLDKAVDLIGRFELLPEDIYAWLEEIDWKSRLLQIGKALLNGVSGLMGTVWQTVSSVFSGIVTGLLSVIFAVYLLAGKEDLARQGRKVIDKFVPQKRREQLLHVLAVLNDSFHKFIVGQCVEALILGVLCMIGMWILRLPYAPMISALIAFTALIPVAGAYIGAGVGAFMILTVSPVQALIFLAFIIVLQQLEGNLVYPRVVGTSIGLPALWVLTAVTVGGGVMGVAGMLIGVPLAAALYRLLHEHIDEQPKKAEEELQAAD